MNVDFDPDDPGVTHLGIFPDGHVEISGPGAKRIVQEHRRVQDYRCSCGSQWGTAPFDRAGRKSWNDWWVSHCEEIEVAVLAEVFKAAWHRADELNLPDRTHHGISAVLFAQRGKA